MSTQMGSSPLARGAQHAVGDAARLDGIIPACAGSTASSADVTFSRRDHPRLRGEHSFQASLRACPAGSSPLARGARQKPAQNWDDAGIIPACAGSTNAEAAKESAEGDHPRLRGEHLTYSAPSRLTRGSSPLARGAPPRGGSITSALRIIPACAGSTHHGAVQP